MTYIKQHISQLVSDYFEEQYQQSVPEQHLVVSETKEEFSGDYTLVVFPLVRIAKSKPEVLAQELGTALVHQSAAIISFNVVKGFLNLSLSPQFWLEELRRQQALENVIPQIGEGKILLEYCSPNSNKPLHLGHVRNILLGWSVGKMLQAVGYDVHYTQIVNDRGIAICKSMISWLKFFDGETPMTKGLKSDHFVGDTYVRFGEEIDNEYAQWQNSDEAKSAYERRTNQAESASDFFKGYKNAYFNEHSPLGKETREMLLAWEDNDGPTRNLWRQMNEWFLEGFSTTCERLGVGFDSMNFESDTYLLGKDIVREGLDKGVFYREEDQSVWIDLTDAGYDKKIVLRSDGTSVYMTQDLGTARTRYDAYQMDGMIYTVGNEQNYHFEVLFEILKRLEEPYADHLYHLSYGMVDLPSGRMKTREGTVVDADDLIDEVINRVAENTEERGELQMLTDQERQNVIETIGIGALKYYMLRVDAKKRMVFNPEESVDLQGQTGPYIQNAYVRIKSIMRRLGDQNMTLATSYSNLQQEEKNVLKVIMDFGDEVVAAVGKYDPSVIASYAYRLARNFHKFYHEHSIAKAESEDAQIFRYQLAAIVAERLESAMGLLGISMPERM